MAEVCPDRLSNQYPGVSLGRMGIPATQSRTLQSRQHRPDACYLQTGSYSTGPQAKPSAYSIAATRWLSLHPGIAIRHTSAARSRRRITVAQVAERSMAKISGEEPIRVEVTVAKPCRW
jgi:hypothetical protein